MSKTRWSRLVHKHAVASLTFLLLAFMGAAFAGGSPAHRTQREPGERLPGRQADVHVVMISIDGMVPDYYTRPEALGLKVPTMVSMRLNGGYAEGVEGVYPTVTYPAHTTLVTGVRPAVHGIVQNRIFEAPTDPETKAWYWYSKSLRTQTLWSLAKKAGLSTAAVGWPVTVGADIDYNIPEIWDPLESPITGKRSIENSTPGLIDKAFPKGVASRDDEFRTEASEFILKSYRPNLMLIHLADLDSTHHLTGPRTKAALAMAERQDGYIKRLVDATREGGFFDKTTFFIVSDHGFAAINKQFEPNVALVQAKLITLDGQGKPVSWKAAAWPAGGSCGIVLHDPNDKETARQVTELFSRIAKQQNPPISDVLRRGALDKLEAMPPATLTLDGADGYTFGGGFTGPEIHDTALTYRGTHGYLPTKPQMRASLIVFGERARAGSHMALARMIDIGPTAALVLGLSIPKSEGRPINALIKR
jgi:predicted AlkP superfamily pyrophosphatase or phosphodiesterase